MVRIRQVVGEIRKTNGNVWDNCQITFTRKKCSYTSDSQLPPDIQKVVTNSLGRFSINLWCNEDGELISDYECSYPGCKFNFSIPFGNGSPIDLSVLRTSSGSVETTPQTLLNYIDEQIEEGFENVIAGEYEKLLSSPLTSISPLSALRIIESNSLNYASANNLSFFNSSLGFTTSSINVNESFKLLLKGEFIDNSWNWELNKPVFLGINGFLTQNILENFLFIQQVATVINSTKIFIDIKEPVKI